MIDELCSRQICRLRDKLNVALLELRLWRLLKVNDISLDISPIDKFDDIKLIDLFNINLLYIYVEKIFDSSRHL